MPSMSSAGDRGWPAEQARLAGAQQDRLERLTGAGDCVS